MTGRSRILGGLVCGMAMMWMSGRLAAGPAEVFADAGERLAGGDAAGAARAYDALLATNGPTVALLHNLGLARLQAGEPGRALAAWRRAELLDPRDADLRGNIAYVRRQMNLQGPGPARFGPVRPDEWATLTAFVWWIWGGLSVAGLASPVWRDRTARARMAAMAASVALAGITALAAWLRWTGPSAVVVLREAPVHVAPAGEAPGAGTVAEGAEVRVLRRHRDWYEVGLDGQRLGWVAASAVELYAPEIRHR